jgi:hypothetical protein
VEKQDEAIHTWAYISGGIEAVMDKNGNKLGVAERWQQCFVESGKEPDWASTFVTQSGLKTADGNDLPSWTDSDDTLRQVAGYLDSLVSLAILAKCAGLSSISQVNTGSTTTLAKVYSDSAIAVFGEAGTWARSPDHRPRPRSAH